MKVFQLNYSDIDGGAARAAYRIHQSVREIGVDSTMLVNYAKSGDCTVRGPNNKIKKFIANARMQVGMLPKRWLQTKNPIIHSPAILPSGWPRYLNGSDADVLHLHWINREMLSIADIGRLRKPVMWTLHDMWAFCGAEHITEEFRWREGYRRNNRPTYESGFDLNLWTWKRKHRHWFRPLQIVTPSNWLADCVRHSVLMREWPVRVIPNAINTNIWQPVERSLARQLLRFPQNERMLLFGAVGGGAAPHKGFDLLKSSLEYLRGEVSDIRLVVFGQLTPCAPTAFGFPIHYTGCMYDDISLNLLYSAADAMIIPSRQDNLPNTGVEAHACGTPVVAFAIGGLPDIVEHKKTGYLAKPFAADDLANGIKWVLEHGAERNLAANARERAVTKFSYPIVASQYLKCYEELVNL